MIEGEKKYERDRFYLSGDFGGGTMHDIDCAGCMCGQTAYGKGRQIVTEEKNDTLVRDSLSAYMCEMSASGAGLVPFDRKSALYIAVLCFDADVFLQR